MRRIFAMATVVLAVAAFFLPPTTASAGPTGPPPGNAHVLSAGQVPTTCTASDGDNGASAYGSTYGYYWSDVSNRWVQAPWCYPRWGFMAMTPSQVISAGDEVTMTALPDDPNMEHWIKDAHLGTMDWSHPGELVDGCGLYDMFCTVRIGEHNRPPGEWSWGEFHVSGPGRVFVLPESYAPRCQKDAPCLDTYTNAWGFAGLRPAYASPPTADFTYTVDGGTVDFTATSTDPANSTLFHEWDFDDGTGSGFNPSHTYTTSGTYHVTLTSTNLANLSDSITKDVEVTAEPLSITNVVIDTSDAQVGDPAKATIEITNSGATAVTAVTPVVTVTPPEIVKLADGEQPPTFDLAGGEKKSFDLTIDPLKGGEAFLNVLASGTLDGSTTSAKARQLAFDVLDPALRVEPITPETKLVGEETTAKAKISNHSAVAIVDIFPTLEADPADGVTRGAPDPEFIARLEPDQEVTVSWPLTVDDKDKHTLKFTAVGHDDAAPPNDVERKGEGTIDYTAADDLLTVNTNGDQALPADPKVEGACDVDEDTDGNQCTLRAALQLANDRDDNVKIEFDIDGAGVPKISPATPLPDITATVNIDGRTQAAKFVELSGSGSGTGLHVLGHGSVIAGLVVNNFEVGLDLGGDGGHRIIGNRIGTDAAGAVAKANTAGIRVNGPNVTIGGTTGTSTEECSGDCNLVSGNGIGVDAAVYNGQPADSTENFLGFPGTQIEGNWIGVDATGTLAIGNGDGVKAASDTIVGGATTRAGAAPGNLVSGNRLGLEMHGHSSAMGNLVGATHTGTEAVGTGGIGIDSTTNSIIGGGEGEGNVIVGQRLAGATPVHVPVSTSTAGIGLRLEGGRAIGNLIGIGLNGVVLPNDVGLFTSPPGGLTTDNTISGNDVGVAGGDSVAVPCGSRIGTDPTGTAAIPNRVGVLGTHAFGPVGGVSGCATTIVSGNTDAGFDVQGFQLNGPLMIGTDPFGTAAIPNGIGIRSTAAASSNASRIAELDGGLAHSGCVDCLVVAGNTGDGVAISSTGAVRANLRIGDALIGVTGNGTILPNGGAGIDITAPIGDDGAGNDSFVTRSAVVGNAGPGLVLADPLGSDGALLVSNTGFSRNSKAIESHIGASRIDSVERNADGTLRVRGATFGTSRSIEFFANRPAFCQAEVPLAHATQSLSGAFDITVPAPLPGFDAISIITTNTSGRPSEASPCVTVALSTTVSEHASAGSTEVAVTSNDGWGAGDYARLGPDGPVRRVDHLGSLVFDAPIPFDLEVGTVITRVAPPDGDTTPPTIDVSAPTANAVLALGQDVTPAATCTDSGVGLEACSIGALDTSTVGTKVFVVTAWDSNGNMTQTVVPYSVGYGELPRTGAPVAREVLLGIALLDAGLLLMTASGLIRISRRRRRFSSGWCV
jgi:PKD repeat protein